MAYATRSQLEERYGIDEVAQREQATSSTSVQKSLDDASAFLDSYFVGRYEVPLIIVPPNVVQVACVVARYNLLGESVTERARMDYQDAIRWLERVADGKLSLTVVTQAQSSDAMNAVFSSDTPVFKRGL